MDQFSAVDGEIKCMHVTLVYVRPAQHGVLLPHIRVNIPIKTKK